MLRLFWKLYWKITGWKIVGQFPYHLKKMVIIVAPHTSWTDILVAFAVRNELKIYDAKFLGKKELFIGPLGWLLSSLGGTPVDRTVKHGMVNQVARLFASHESFLLAMAPEGTRKKVDKLRSGFYHIAKTADVPLLPIGLDFKNKQLVIGEAFYASNDETDDLKKIIAFFSSFTGKNPAGDLRHFEASIMKETDTPDNLSKGYKN